jgi:hypothetical protein
VAAAIRARPVDLHYDAHHWHAGDINPTNAGRPHGVFAFAVTEPIAPGDFSWQTSSATVNRSSTLYALMHELLDLSFCDVKNERGREQSERHTPTPLLRMSRTDHRFNATAPTSIATPIRAGTLASFGGHDHQTGGGPMLTFAHGFANSKRPLPRAWSTSRSVSARRAFRSYRSGSTECSP